MNPILFLAINSTLNGHLLVAWAMALNAFAWARGETFGPWGVLFGALALVSAHLLSTPEIVEREGRKLYYASFFATLLAWLLWLLPAVLR